MKHFFDVYVAKTLGINSAILLENLYFWIKKNEANKKHYYDGKYWTYNSVEAFTKLFPYFSYDSIRYSLEKLEKAGYIITGNYNPMPMDKTKWYALTEKAYSLLDNSQMDLGFFPDGNGDNTRAIPDNKQTDKKTKKDKSFLEEQAPHTEKPPSKQEIIASVYDDPSNIYIVEALRKYQKWFKDTHTGYQGNTVAKWAKILRENAGEDPTLAMAIVDQSITNGWKSLYSLKKQPKRDAVIKPVTGETVKTF